MSSKPLHAFLVTRLHDCLESGTSASEKGLKVSTEKLAGETILFFHTDCNEGRHCLQITDQKNKKVCDYIIYYSKEIKQSEIVCFLELKGTNLEDAAKQVTETRKHLKIILSTEISSEHYEKITWRICICLRSHAPSVNQCIREELKRRYGSENVEIKHGVPRPNIGPFLRREPDK
jgi:hypothetical protein